MRKILTIMAVLLVAACSGPNDHSVCIPDKSGGSAVGGTTQATSTQTTNTGTAIQNYEQVEQKLKDKKIISTIVEKVKTILVGNGFSGGAAQKLFSGFVNSPMFKAAISATFTLYVIIYGIMIVGGLTQASLGDIAIRIIKMAFITYIGLNWAAFYNLIGKTSIDATDELIGMMISPFSSSAVSSISVGGVTASVGSVFASLDNMIASMFL